MIYWDKECALARLSLLNVEIPNLMAVNLKSAITAIFAFHF
jgi:hypothetical protein